MKEDLQENNFLILIVDDIPKNIQLLGKILENRGYRVLAATDGEQALKAAERHSPDLILLDIMMPGLSGYDVCGELKADEELSEIPVIFLTARSDEEDIIKGFELGGSDYVTKPFNSGELLVRIQTHLSLKKARDQIIEQQEELRQITKTKDKLYSIVAHDLKGALAGISGLADIVDEELGEETDNDGIKNYINLISNSSTSANLILENLLSWTNMQWGELEIDPEKFSLREEIDIIIHLYHTLANKKGIEISVESEAETDIIFADKQMISTVVRNLISNAIKFSNKRDRITIQVEESDTGNTVKLSVKDEGTGMSEDIQQNIFNPDNRPKRKGTDNEGGIGLGLLMCKEFIEAHNGEIYVESKLGEGSEFSFNFPVENNPADVSI